MSIPVLVSTEWLNQNLNDGSLVILDATLAKPKSAGNVPNQELQIPGAQFFDIDGSFSDHSIDLPHMMCDPAQFKREAQKLGINQNSHVVVYDNHGVYSSPRAWWMLKSMGVQKVSVLNGGLPQWIEKEFKTELKQEVTIHAGNYEPEFDASCFWNAEQVQQTIDDTDVVVLDARSSGRFYGTESEPREGLRSGHIPKSISLPFAEVIDGYQMKNRETLQSMFDPLDLKGKKLVFSCGSGLTACIILLAAYIARYPNLAVYDGSWSEWGQPSDLPVVTT